MLTEKVTIIDDYFSSSRLDKSRIVSSGKAVCVTAFGWEIMGWIHRVHSTKKGTFGDTHSASCKLQNIPDKNVTQKMNRKKLIGFD